MGRISKMKRDLIMEANKRLLNEMGIEPDLSTCDWFLMDVSSLDGKTGELHLKQTKKGLWSLEKFSNVNNIDDVTEGVIKVPQQNEIQVSWDKDTNKIKLEGDKTLDGLDAYNKILGTSNDANSCKLIYASDQPPSEHGLIRDYQYLIFSELKLAESKELPPWIVNKVKRENGVILNENSYFIKKKLFGKPTYCFISFNDEVKYNNSIKPCDKFYDQR